MTESHYCYAVCLKRVDGSQFSFLMGQCYRNNLKNLASLLAVSLVKPRNKWARIIKSSAAFDPFQVRSEWCWLEPCVYVAKLTLTLRLLWLLCEDPGLFGPLVTATVNLALLTVPAFTVAACCCFAAIF